MPEVERKFLAILLIVCAPFCLVIWGFVAAFALAHRDGRPIGMFLGLVWLVVAFGVVRTPYVAVLRSDGSITFRSLTRSVTTRVDDIYRVGTVRSGRARGYAFFFDDRKALLGWDGGLALTRYLVERNPALADRR